ncbi:uncharacterized protein LOC134277861, partial [Saccostrea cucullata]|uniref:uncharacterized protein LOC134277861 n=1 Tax=Saccostrea cuccullata TaxID=36930 RepID=UPI002ED36491
EPRQCMIIQDKQGLLLPRRKPEFLTSRNKEMCQIRNSSSKALRCGNTSVSIKPECVCSFHNLYEAMYHDHFSCPGEVKSDNVRLLRCGDCMEYSLQNKGPCIHGGQLTCKETGPDVEALNIRCDCPLRFEGMFCENKMEKVTRICDRNENASSLNYLQNCDRTKMDCITYSENKRYTFKCTKKSATILRGKAELPICRETEINTTELNAAITPEGDIRLTNPQYTSRGKSLTPTLSFILFLREYELL